MKKAKFKIVFFFFLSPARSVRICIMCVCTYMCKVDHLTQHFRILPTMWMKYFIKLHLNVYKTFKIVGYYFQKKSLMSYADLVICQKIKCNYFKFIMVSKLCSTYLKSQKNKNRYLFIAAKNPKRQFHL